MNRFRCRLVALVSLPLTIALGSAIVRQASVSASELTSVSDAAPANKEYDLSRTKLPPKVREALFRELARLEALSTKRVLLTVDAGGVKQVRSPVLGRILPAHVFVLVPYDMKSAPGSEAHVSVPVGLYATVAVDRETGNSERLPGYGNHEEFGSFLAKHRVSLKTDKDASEIWDAFCVIHQKNWHEGRHVKVGPESWRLNCHERTDSGLKGPIRVHAFYEIVTTPDGRVLKGSLKSVPAALTAPKPH